MWRTILPGLLLGLGTACTVDGDSDGDGETAETADPDAVQWREVSAGDNTISELDTGSTTSVDDCSTFTALLAPDQATLDTWEHQAWMSGSVDWSSEVAVAAWIDCNNGMRDLQLVSLRDAGGGVLEAEYESVTRGFQTDGYSEAWRVVAVPASGWTSVSATVRARLDTGD